MAVKDFQAVVKKYRWAALVLLCGILLMCLPLHKQVEKTETALPETPQQTLEEALEKILAQVAGAGEVRVLLSGQLSETKRYQTDDSQSGSGELRQETVILTGENRVQTALVRQTEAATYRGAIVVCQGAQDPTVKLAIVEAVAAVTGLSTNRITVLKMK